MSDKYKVISEFCCNGKPMVTVRIGSAAHVRARRNGIKFMVGIIKIDGI